MRSRNLQTTPVVIVSNYRITPDPATGKFLHEFTPETTSTVYQFIGNREPIFTEGERYNIGYEVENGTNIVDVSASAKADEVDPVVSHNVARILGEQCSAVETTKSDQRVVHSATSGHYLGKKYAWRIYGMAVAKGTFYDYLEEIRHPSVPCTTEDSASTAYLDTGINTAMDNLINSCSRVGASSNRFSSPLLPSKSWFTIKGISAISDKK
jgi:hypothetical protein